jgi:hypothetical protein
MFSGNYTYRSRSHDHNRIFSGELDRSVRNLKLHVLKTPPQSCQASSRCERVLGMLWTS